MEVDFKIFISVTILVFTANSFMFNFVKNFISVSVVESC